eukprot:TRINITY_DN7304_c0_g1_i1.p3 TRINITY_DN7304_c0_g1~~TRINITY_DN7304_c0_g1_i1.p3  ORF type:complete len:104 (-),score=7.52 TRINITY_DN7304_c0_g1_i1:48-359(-)
MQEAGGGWVGVSRDALCAVARRGAVLLARAGGRAGPAGAGGAARRALACFLLRFPPPPAPCDAPREGGEAVRGASIHGAKWTVAGFGGSGEWNEVKGRGPRIP